MTTIHCGVYVTGWLCNCEVELPDSIDPSNEEEVRAYVQKKARLALSTLSDGWHLSGDGFDCESVNLVADDDEPGEWEVEPDA